MLYILAGSCSIIASRAAHGLVAKEVTESKKAWRQVANSLSILPQTMIIGDQWLRLLCPLVLLPLLFVTLLGSNFS